MKRFTETEKWSDPWFRKLSPELKLAYLYLLDRCDHAGVCDIDAELADFQIGVGVDWDKFLAQLGDRCERLKSGKWHMTKFVAFQFGKLSEASKPHLNVLRLLDSHGLKERVSKGYPKGIHTHKDKDKDKEQETDKDKGEVQEGSDASEVYALYPKKVGRDDALKSINKRLKEGITAEHLKERTRMFNEAVACWPHDERKFIPHASTWFNQGRYDDDPSEWKRQPTKPATPKPDRINFETDDYSKFQC